MYNKWVGYTNTGDVEFVDTTRVISHYLPRTVFPPSPIMDDIFVSKPKDGVIKILKCLNPCKALGLVRVFSDVLVAFL